MPQGIFDTSSAFLPVDFAKKSFAAAITRLMPAGAAPLFGITSMIKSDTAIATEHGYWTKTMVFPEGTNSAGNLVGDTTLGWSSTANVLPGMLMRNQRTQEQVIINSVPNSTSITVTRAVGTVVAAAININDKWYQVGTAFEEASSRPTAMNIAPVKITNLTQIFRNSWAVSGSADQVQVVAGDSNLAESKQECAAFHAVDIEKALIFGQKSQGTRNTKPFRTMEGLVSIIGNLAYYPSSYSTPNVSTAGATTTYSQLEGFLDPCFNQVSDPTASTERLLFVGSTARKVINGIGRISGQYQIVDGASSFGLQFQSFKIARGMFRMVEHPLLNSNADWSKMAIAIDLGSFNVAYLGNRKTQHKSYNMSGETASDNGIDAIGGTLTTELTAILKNPPANGIIHGLTAAA